MSKRKNTTVTEVNILEVKIREYEILKSKSDNVSNSIKQMIHGYISIGEEMNVKARDLEKLIEDLNVVKANLEANSVHHFKVAANFKNLLGVE